VEPKASAEPRRLRADAARNRQRLIDAAEEVFAERGLDATLDDIAKHAGVNVATAYRHFDNKHELARAFLQHQLDRANALAREAAEAADPWTGLTQFLEQAVRLMTSSRGFVDALSNAYGAEWFSEQMHDLLTGPIRLLVTRAQEAGAVRADLDATDFALILPMLASVSERGLVAGLPEPFCRYLSVVLAGLRPDGTPLPGRATSDAELRADMAAKADKHARARARGQAVPEKC